jgi:hypothetical protein
MEFIEQLQEKWNIDLVIFLIVMVSGFFQERYLSNWYIVKDARLCAALKTLIVSFVAGTIYIFIVYKQSKTDGAEVLIPWGKYFITYFMTTSIYDILVRPFRKWITKITGDDDKIKTPTDGN